MAFFDLTIPSTTAAPIYEKTQGSSNQLVFSEERARPARSLSQFHLQVVLMLSHSLCRINAHVHTYSLDQETKVG